MITDSNAAEREAFINKLVESVNLDEWVESYFVDADGLNSVAVLDDVAGDAVLQDPHALEYHWQRREVYNAFTEEIWAAIWSAADKDESRSPLEWLVEYEDDRVIDKHEDFIDLMVVRALSIVARDLMEG